MTAWVWYLAVVGVMLVLSAIFSGSETALFSLSHTARDQLRRDRPAVSRRVERFLKHPARALAAILLSNLLVNVTASSLFTLAVIDFTRGRGLNPALSIGIGGLVMTGVLLVFGEVTPKVLATHRSVSFITRVSSLLAGMQWLLTPFTGVLTRFTAALTPRNPEPECLSEEELHTMIKVGRKRGILVAREEEILWNLVGLEERTVSEVMTPRIDMDSIERRASIADAMELCRLEGRSRLPVYDGAVDNIVGIAYAKELLTAPDRGVPVETVMRPAQFVPEQKRLPMLLEEQRKKGSHIAVVVDEFGQTAGVVTLEDALEAIFGEIADEYDSRFEDLPYIRLRHDSYLVEGEIDVATLNRLFEGAFEDIEHERLAALIHERLGRLPEAGDVILQNGLEMVVREMDGNKLEKVIIRRRRDEHPGPER